jgi:hypothetical protein
MEVNAPVVGRTMPRSLLRPQLLYRRLPQITLMASALLLTACADTPQQPTAVASPPAPPPVADLYYTPTGGQDNEQQAEDRYACFLWASRQTGFDPSSPYLPPGERFDVVAANSFAGTGTANASEEAAPNTPARRYRKAMRACLEGRGYAVR